MVSYVLIVRIRTNINAYLSYRVTIEWNRALFDTYFSSIVTKSIIFECSL